MRDILGCAILRRPLKQAHNIQARASHSCLIYAAIARKMILEKSKCLPKFRPSSAFEPFLDKPSQLIQGRDSAHPKVMQPDTDMQAMLASIDHGREELRGMDNEPVQALHAAYHQGQEVLIPPLPQEERCETRVRLPDSIFNQDRPVSCTIEALLSLFSTLIKLHLQRHIHHARHREPTR